MVTDRTLWGWKKRKKERQRGSCSLKSLKRGGSGVLLFVVFAAIALSACGKGQEGGLSGPAGPEGQQEGQQETAVPEPPAHPEQAEAYQVKAERLKEKAMEDWVSQELGLAPAGEAGHAVFLSVCDTTERASVFTGTGSTLEEAWEAADTKARTAVGASGLEPVWVKADVTYLSETIGTEELKEALSSSRPGYFRYGVAFDPAFETALLEAELNSAEIYVYGEDEADGEAGEENGGTSGIDLEYLNAYLEENGRKPLEALPEEYTVFQCVGWICEEGGPAAGQAESGSEEGEQAESDSEEGEQAENGAEEKGQAEAGQAESGSEEGGQAEAGRTESGAEEGGQAEAGQAESGSEEEEQAEAGQTRGSQDYVVWQLSGSGLSYGGRQIELVDDACAREMIRSASAFLAEQVQEDGSFLYGIYPSFDEEAEGYNMVRHASTIWSLLCSYRTEPDQALADKIDRTVDYMLDQVVYDEEGRAYLYEKTDDEIKLGGSALAVVALTEYMDIFQTETYEEVCKALGEGILSQQDGETGAFYHVLNGDFTQKEESRTVYYDGEAAFALCRLYGLTEEEKWLDGAERTIGHFIQEDYTQYIDHWVAYSLNEFTKYRPDETEVYVFAMRNALENLDKIYQQETTYPTYLELLMATFEIYERMQENGMIVGDDAREMLLKVIYARADRMRNGYFYPEYAMYMADPQRVLGSFMVRHERYRVRIDDVQHNIGGYQLYLKDYDRLVESGLLEAR